MASIIGKLQRDYAAVFDELVERGLLRDFNRFSAHKTQYSSTLSWTGNPQLSYLFGDYSSLEHYQLILRNRDYCFCFSDGGVVQMLYIVGPKGITYHRLCYFPCPFDFSLDEVGEISLEEFPLLFNADELRQRIRLGSPLRFDFDAEFGDERHANSHLTVNKASCRVPVFGPVSPGHFLRFVLRYFYESEIEIDSVEKCSKPRFYNRTLSHPPPHEVYMDTAFNY